MNTSSAQTTSSPGLYSSSHFLPVLKRTHCGWKACLETIKSAKQVAKKKVNVTHNPKQLETRHLQCQTSILLGTIVNQAMLRRFNNQKAVHKHCKHALWGFWAMAHTSWKPYIPFVDFIDLLSEFYVFGILVGESVPSWAVGALGSSSTPESLDCAPLWFARHST